MGMDKRSSFCLKACRPKWPAVGGWGWRPEKGKALQGGTQVRDCKIVGTFFTLLLGLYKLTFFGSLFMALSLVLENGH